MVVGEAVTVYTVVGKERLNHMEGWGDGGRNVPLTSS